MLQTLANRERSAGPETRRVLAVYEDASTRRHAIQFCNQLASQYHPDVAVDISWFSLESLDEPGELDIAVDKACSADVIVFAVVSMGDLTRPGKLWIERWLGKRKQHEGALAGLIVDHPRRSCELPCLKEIYLRHIAQRAGMDYSSGDIPTIGQAIPDSLESYNRRAGQITAVLDQILHTRPPASPRL
jgi:hypothetical protein